MYMGKAKTLTFKNYSIFFNIEDIFRCMIYVVVVGIVVFDWLENGEW